MLSLGNIFRSSYDKEIKFTELDLNKIHPNDLADLKKLKDMCDRQTISNSWIKISKKDLASMEQWKKNKDFVFLLRSRKDESPVGFFVYDNHPAKKEYSLSTNFIIDKYAGHGNDVYEHFAWTFEEILHKRGYGPADDGDYQTGVHVFSIDS